MIKNEIRFLCKAEATGTVAESSGLNISPP